MKKEPCYACKTQPRKKTYIVCEACFNKAIKKRSIQEKLMAKLKRLERMINESL